MYKIKNKIAIITVFVIIVSSLSNICCYATDENIKEENASYSDITRSIEYIRQDISYINNKVLEMKKTDLYNNYPAIRLNVETPIFGINSVIEKKMTIKTGVSTADIISGYSIYDIVRTSRVKVPSLSVGSVVVATREIEISKEMSMSDANSALKVLLECMKQADEVKNFVDNYIDKNFTDYVESDIKNRIQNVNDNIDSVLNRLEKLNGKLKVIEKEDTQLYNDYMSKYDEIFDNALSVKKEVSDILIEEEKLTELEDEIGKLEISAAAYGASVNESINKISLNNLEYAHYLIMESKIVLSEITSYIASSAEVISVEELKEKNLNNDFSGDVIAGDMDKYTYMHYPVTSENTVNVLKEKIKIEEEYYLKMLDIENASSTNSDKFEEYLDNIQSNYYDVVSQSSNFYYTNYTNLTQNIAAKTEDIINYTDENVSGDYLFSNLYEAKKAQDIINKYDKNGYYGSLKVNQYFKTNITNMINRYSRVNSVYNSLIRSGKIS